MTFYLSYLTFYAVTTDDATNDTTVDTVATYLTLAIVRYISIDVTYQIGSFHFFFFDLGMNGI